MVQISLTHKGVFVLVVGGFALLLFLFSDGSQTSYETNPDVISLRSIFVTLVMAVEEAGRAIKSMHDLQSATPFNLHKKPALLALNPTGHVTVEEVVTEADLLSNYCIIRRIKLLRPDFIVSWCFSVSLSWLETDHMNKFINVLSVNYCGYSSKLPLQILADFLHK